MITDKNKFLNNLILAISILGQSFFLWPHFPVRTVFMIIFSLINLRLLGTIIKKNYLLCLFFAFFFLLITLNAFNYEFLLRFLLGFLVILIITNLVTKKGLDYFLGCFVFVVNLSLLFYVLQEIFSMPIYLRERFGELLYLTNDFRFFNLSRTALSLPVKSGFIFYFSMIIYFSIIIQKFTLMNKKKHTSPFN